MENTEPTKHVQEFQKKKKKKREKDQIFMINEQKLRWNESSSTLRNKTHILLHIIYDKLIKILYLKYLSCLW